MSPLPPDDSLAFLESLIEAHAPSGFEGPVQRVWLERVRTAADSVHTDAYGNAWGVLEPANAAEAPTVVVTGHGDEIGMMVNHIESSGLLRVVPIGGIDAAILAGRRVHVHADPEPIEGVVGAVPIHLQDRREEKKAAKIDQLFVDCGFADDDEAKKHVRVGHPITLADRYQRLGRQRAVSRAFDNRIGIYTAAEVFCRAAERRADLGVRLVALSTVQEEIGGAGALVVTRTIDPDLAFVIDVTHATDVPGISQAKHGAVTLGGGPTVTHGTSNHPALVQHIVEVAKQAEIKIQHEASSRFTGTDTDVIYRSTRGIPSALVSLPNRYMHTPAEVIDLGDLEQLSVLLTETVVALKGKERFDAFEL